ncbi:hypothetical protein GW17_00060887, partial [Ensete ventricosum]
ESFIVTITLVPKEDAKKERSHRARVCVDSVPMEGRKAAQELILVLECDNATPRRFPASPRNTKARRCGGGACWN